MARVGQYQIRELLGSGGIGQVHAALDTVLEREVAIKSLHPALLSDSKFVARFRAEATSLARLNHPNIATVHDLIEEGGNLFLVMELVRGETLEHVLRRLNRPLGVSQSLAVVGQAAEGLSYAHSKGIIHRDIKPANLMIAEGGLLKIMDFGIARVRGSQRLTRDGSILGTLAYMSPEQIRGEPGDERSDLYSLAVVLYEILSGAAPFASDSEYDLMQAHIHARPGRLMSVVPGLDSRVEKVLMQALAKKPDQRFASVKEFSRALGASTGRLDASLTTTEGRRGAVGDVRDRLAWLTAARVPILIAVAAVVLALGGIGAMILLEPAPTVVSSKVGSPVAARPDRGFVPALAPATSPRGSPSGGIVLPPSSSTSTPPVVLQRQ